MTQDRPDEGSDEVQSEGVEQRREIWSSPTQTVRARVKELREKRRWTAHDLAGRCEKAGMPALNRSVIANIESGRRKYVTLDEVFTLAYVLDVAPVHLMVPIEIDESVDEHDYMATPDRFLSVPEAREWVRGQYCPGGLDPRIFWSEVPRQEWEPPQLSADQIEARSDVIRRHRSIVDMVLPTRETDGEPDGS